MTERRGTGITLDELRVEAGEGADPEKVRQQANLISNRWVFPEERPAKPTLLLLGGFQGSGKTSTLEILSQELGLLIISPDEIRYNLFAAEHSFTPQFVTLVNSVKYELIRRALNMGHSAIVDQSLTPTRVGLTESILADFPNHQMLSVFLDAPKEVLIERLNQRQAVQGRYLGTVPELISSLDKYERRYGDPRAAKYDLVVDTVQNNTRTVADLISRAILKIS